MWVRIESLPNLAAALVAALVFAAPAAGATVHVIVVPPFQPHAYAERGAVGLFVPGSGDRVSRAGALASLVRGKVEPFVIGGSPRGRPLISLCHRRASIRTRRATRSPSWAAATTGSSSPTRRGSADWCRSPTSHTPQSPCTRGNGRSCGRVRTGTRLPTWQLSTCG